MSDTPTVSIGLPVYNGDNYLEEALTSMLKQTWVDFELVISDNASTDRTPEICQDLARDDERIRYLPVEENRGANPNYNRAFRHSTGRYFRWAAHDDVLEPTYLERCVELLDAEPELVLAHSDTVLIDRFGDELLPLASTAVDADGFLEALPEGPEFWAKVADRRPSVRFGAVLRDMVYALPIFGLIRRDALLRTRLQQPFYGTDKVLLAELALQGPFGYVDERLFLRRCHPQTSTRMADGGGRRAWSGTGSGWYPTDMARGYVTALRLAELDADERNRCRVQLARKLAEPGKWRMLLLPGPWNLFGWGGSFR